MIPQIALLGFSIECNRFAPLARREDFTRRCWLEGEAIIADARCPVPRALGEMPGFVAAMDAAGPWQPRPILLAMCEPRGPVEAATFAEVRRLWQRGLEAVRGTVDGVYAVMHGAALAEDEEDPEGALQQMVRDILGDIPFVCSYDLHANVSPRMVETVDAFVGYRTNPHVDLRERGAECAHLLRRLIAGERFFRAYRRLPIIPPTVTMLTAQGPFAEVMAFGQHLAATEPGVVNVSVIGGFAYSDTPFSGLTIVVTATAQAVAEQAAQQIAAAAWERRHGFVAHLTPLEEAIRRLRIGPWPVLIADVADNPGGGAHGATTWILEALYRAGIKDALVGMMLDPPLAREAHEQGVGARFVARFNRDAAEDDPILRPFAAEAQVRALSAGQVVGRRGIYAGTAITLGRTACLDLDGIAVVVSEGRAQCADPVFFEHLGLAIGEAKVVVVKSRGHFRAGFDEFFGPDRIIEVDCPGLVSPHLARFPWRRLPRPVWPLDQEVSWP